MLCEIGERFGGFFLLWITLTGLSRLFVYFHARVNASWRSKAVLIDFYRELLSSEEV
jgi:hypothetical protein